MIISNRSDDADLRRYNVRCVMSASDSCFDHSDFYFLRPEVKTRNKEISFEGIELHSPLGLNEGKLHLVRKVNQVFL